MGDRPLLLDLYCGAGGAAVGYQRAGFDVIGVDNEPQPRYPFDFIQGDAIDALKVLRRGVWQGLHRDAIDAVHASPPCQAYSCTRALHPHKMRPELLKPTRKGLQVLGKPWVIENVPGAQMWSPITLCGTQFDGLRVIRHRLFESNLPLHAPPPCPPTWEHPKVATDDRPGDPWEEFLTVAGAGYGPVPPAKDAMGITWEVTRQELNEAVPPAYTEFIGWQMLAHLDGILEVDGEEEEEEAPQADPHQEGEPREAAQVGGH